MLCHMMDNHNSKAFHQCEFFCGLEVTFLGGRLDYKCHNELNCGMKNPQ